LELLLLKHGAELAAAIDNDFGGRPIAETELLELFPSLSIVRHAQRHVSRWMKPERRATSWWYWLGHNQVRYQPLGVVGVIVPWNYPIFLGIGPIASAFAAGNRVLVKFSEFTPTLGEVFAKRVTEHFSPEVLGVVNGGVEVAQTFAKLPFDHLVFTGSTAVGKQVMLAAAQNLTPLTLELGGKSPALITPGFDLTVAARRIAWGKLVNAGQTCVAPDYVLLPRGQEIAFAQALRAAATHAYRDASSRDYTSIVHDRARARLQALLNDAEAHGARLEPLLPPGSQGGGRMVPYAVLNTNDAMRLMQEEIFGPILPLVPYDTLPQAVTYIRSRDKPLALYLFDHNRTRCDELLDATHSGGVTLNDCVLHLAQDDLPFGGIGPSGMGHYHGRDGFLRLSHARAVHRRGAINGLPLFHPPYGKRFATWILERLMLRRS